MSRFYLAIAIFVFLGCSNKHPERTVLPRNQMVKILWDMIQVDELATFRTVKDTSLDVKKERILLYEKVFQLHKTSQKQFSISYTYYQNHPDFMKVIFDSLEARGANERKLTYNTQDSLRK